MDPGVNGERYWLHFTDDYSRFSSVYAMQRKSDATCGVYGLLEETRLNLNTQRRALVTRAHPLVRRLTPKLALSPNKASQLK